MSLVCATPLTRGRRCVHVRGHASRHSHTWHYGDARFLAVGGRLVNMQTGEFAGLWLDDSSRIVGQVKAGSRTRVDALRTLRGHLPGFKVPKGPLVELGWDDAKERPVSESIVFHYHGHSGYSYGRNRAGHDVSVSPRGKTERLYTLNQRRDAVEFAGRFGAAKAARKFDIPAATIRSWARRGE